MFDLMNKLDVKRAISPVSVADNTAQVSQIIDVSKWKSCAFLIALGSIADADATFAVTMDHGNASNLSDAAAVPSDMLNGTLALAGFVFSDDDKCRKIGYRGDKRYVRLTVTPSANASAALLAVLAVGEPLDQPAANPPV